MPRAAPAPPGAAPRRMSKPGRRDGHDGAAGGAGAAGDGAGALCPSGVGAQGLCRRLLAIDRCGEKSVEHGHEIEGAIILGDDGEKMNV